MRSHSLSWVAGRAGDVGYDDDDVSVASCDVTVAVVVVVVVSGSSECCLTVGASKPTSGGGGGGENMFECKNACVKNDEQFSFKHSETVYVCVSFYGV